MGARDEVICSKECRLNVGSTLTQAQIGLTPKTLFYLIFNNRRKLIYLLNYIKPTNTLAQVWSVHHSGHTYPTRLCVAHLQSKLNWGSCIIHAALLRIPHASGCAVLTAPPDLSIFAGSRWGIPLVTKVMRKEARHTQRRDRASGVRPDILEHFHPQKNQSLPTLLLCALTSDFTGGCPLPPSLSLSVKELTYSSN